MDELKIKKSIDSASNRVHSSKYHQASFVYLLNAIVYFSMATFRMPPHDFGMWNYLFYTLGIIFLIIFPYLIYKEYRIFTAILSVIYLIRTVVTLLAIPYYSILMVFMFILHAFTFFMLTRAAWDIKKTDLTIKSRKDTEKDRDRVLKTEIFNFFSAPWFNFSNEKKQTKDTEKINYPTANRNKR